MIRNISVGIDVGSSVTKVVVGEFIKGEKYPKIIGVGESATFGMRHGYVISTKEVSESIKKAVNLAEKTSDIKIKRAFLGINNSSLKGEMATGTAIIGKADGEVTNLDIEKATEEAKKSLNLTNKKILQTFQTSYKLDNAEIIGKIEGMKGNKIEVKVLFITCSNQHFESLIDALTDTEIEPLDIIPLILSSANFILNKKQKMVGSAIANIGAETTSFATFENDVVTSLQVFPIGANDITNDIALGFKTNLEEAENIKINNTTEKYSKKKIDEIIDARLEDIFDSIQNHLKKIKRTALLPAGIVFIGGGANTTNLEELSKKSLLLPSKIGQAEMFVNTKTKLKEASWLPVVSLIFTELDNGNSKTSSLYSSNFFEKIKNIIKQNLKQLMP